MMEKRKDWKLSERRPIGCTFNVPVGIVWVGNQKKKKMLQLHKQGLGERQRATCWCQLKLPFGWRQTSAWPNLQFFCGCTKINIDSRQTNISALTKWLDLYTDSKTLYPGGGVKNQVVLSWRVPAADSVWDSPAWLPAPGRCRLKTCACTRTWLGPLPPATLQGGPWLGLLRPRPQGCGSWALVLGGCCRSHLWLWGLQQGALGVPSLGWGHGHWGHGWPLHLFHSVEIVLTSVRLCLLPSPGAWRNMSSHAHTHLIYKHTQKQTHGHTLTL